MTTPSQDDFDALLNLVTDTASAVSRKPLAELMAGLPTLASLGPDTADAVILRLDLDVSVKDGAIVDSTRLDNSLDTIRFCLEKGWRVTILGHIGRDASNSLRPVRDYLVTALGADIAFVADWLDTGSHTLSDAARAATADPSNRMVMFENTRRYDVERALWKASDVTRDQMYTLARSLAEHVGTVLINDAIAASNLDFSSTVLPFVMEQSVLGFFSDGEFRNHATAAMKSDFIVFSGLKSDKLDSLEQVVNSGRARLIVVAGAIAMALIKARHRMAGADFGIGLAETDPKAKSYISPERIDQAAAIVTACEAAGIDLILPVDFVLDDGTVSDTIPDGKTQLDIGPKSAALFHDKAIAYAGAPGPLAKSMYYNGVFGMFEDPRFEGGTRAFVDTVQALTGLGVKTYIGGGEGRLAVARFGDLTQVTHAFTCGGTILKCMALGNVGFLRSMYLGNGG